MSTLSHPPAAAPETGSRMLQLAVTEMWAALAIVAMWIAVAVSAVWGPDFVTRSPGDNSTTIPSAIAVAVFASVGTWAVAKYGFGARRDDTD